MDSGQDTRRWFIRGLSALGLVAAGGAVAASSMTSETPSTPEQAPFDPTKGEIVRLTPGRGLQSEVLTRYPGEKEIVVAVRKLSAASGGRDQQNVDHFLTKESPLKWQGEYIPVSEGSNIEDTDYKVDKVDPGAKSITLEVTANGKVDKITISTDFSNPQNEPFTFRDKKGRAITVVAALGRKREELKGGIAPDTAQLPDRVVLHRTTSAPTTSTPTR
ncbi:MAG: hypothetical protein Q7S79_02700 [bacterium]|nr:hypothetical protein [bacterium]